MKVLTKDMHIVHDESVYYLVIEKLKHLIIIKCLEQENYLITDKQAENLARIIIKQAISLKVFNKVLKKLGII